MNRIVKIEEGGAATYVVMTGSTEAFTCPMLLICQLWGLFHGLGWLKVSG